MKLQTGDLAGRVQSRNRFPIRLLHQKGTAALLRTGDHDCPVGGVTIEDQRFHPIEHPGGAFSPGPGSHCAEWISVTELVKGHRSPGPPGGEIRQ